MYKKGNSQINLSSVFFGSEQSKYTGIALFGTIFILCLAILFSSSKIPIDQRLAFVIFILLVSIPSILMSLFELTCIVTGGNYNTRWWCWLLAWVIAVIIIFYCISVIIGLIMSMSGFDLANKRADEVEEDTSIDIESANKIAEDVIEKYYSEKNNGAEKGYMDMISDGVSDVADGTIGKIVGNQQIAGFRNRSEYFEEEMPPTSVPPSAPPSAPQPPKQLDSPMAPSVGGSSMPGMDDSKYATF